MTFLGLYACGGEASLPAHLQGEMEGLLLPEQKKQYGHLKKQYQAVKAEKTETERKEWRRKLEKFVLKCMKTETVPMDI